MSIKDAAKKAAERIRALVSGAGIHDAELAPAEDPDAVKEFLFDNYKAWTEKIQELSKEWVQNRQAYMATGQDHFNGLAKIPKVDEDPAIYCSGIVADMVDDLAAMQVNSDPKVYPLPELDPEFMIDPNLLGDFTPQQFNKRVWEVCVDDFWERRNFSAMNYKNAKAARITGIVITKQRVGFDHQTQQLDIFVDTVQPEHFVMDPATTTLDLNGCSGCYHTVYLTPMDAVRRWPDFKEDILKSIIETTDEKVIKNSGVTLRSGGTSKETRDFIGKVAVVEAYFRDETELHQKAEQEIFNEVSGEYDIETHTIIEKKYPKGRRITFLPDCEVVLKDEPNPYNGYPFAIFVSNEVDWSVYGKADATALRAVQAYADKVWQQAYVNLKQCGNAKIIASSNILDELDNSVGQKIPSDHAGNVKIMMPPSLIGDAMNMHASVRDEASHISGVYAPNEGMQTSSPSSGRAIGLLQETGNRKVKPSQVAFKGFMRCQWAQILDLMKDLYEAGRKMRSGDEDGAPAILPYALSASTLSVDVKIDANTQFPADPISRLNIFLQMMNTKAEDGLGIIDRAAFLNMTNFPGASDVMRRIKQSVTAQTMQGAAGVQGMNNLQQNMALQQAQSQQPGGMLSPDEQRAQGAADTMPREQSFEHLKQ